MKKLDYAFKNNQKELSMLMNKMGTKYKKERKKSEKKQYLVNLSTEI